MATDAGSKGKRPKCECPFYKRIPTTSITVDAFQFGAVPDCSAYFLTHFHTDHYGGLTAKFKGNVYCSEGTAALVAGMLKLPRSQIFPLSMETPTMVAGTECTLLDANHCPGSVLILFKLRDGRIILHTGDFRATSSMPNHPLLRDVNIHTLYLDTTYLDPKYCFPLQEECTERVIVETRRFLANNPTALILVGTYSIGKERVFLALAKALGWKACVDRRKLAMLKAVMPHALPQLTLDGTLTRLHIVPMSSLSKVKIAKYTSERLRGIPAFSGVLAWRPTGWTHTWGSASKGAGATAAKGSVDVRGVDYSEHSSYAELRNFVQSTQPTKIIPTVNNGSAEKRAEMSAAFRTWLGRSV
jgi:DNA cross-link repair 1A protein